MKLPEPTKAIALSSIKKFDSNLRFRASNAALKKLLTAFPDNKSEESVILKATTLNSLYSTRIFDIIGVSKHIHSLRIDNRLKRRDLSLVYDIASNTLAGEKFYFRSFASKYCALHCPKYYAIYDKYVDEALWKFSKQYEFASFLRKDLKHYETFIQIIRDFRRFFKLKNMTFRQIDKYLWIVGRHLLEKH